MEPWWNLIRPKQDIIDGKANDLGVYAIHLDQIASKDSNAPTIYTNPEKFFDNTVITDGIMKITQLVCNRLSGINSNGAVIDLNTVFGGGKTHSLVHLYHLFGNGEAARKWISNDNLFALSNVLGTTEIPKSEVLTWVGTNFSHNKLDSNGMRTPWGQILGQIGKEAIEKIRPFDKDLSRPDTTTIREILSGCDKPILILMDEILSGAEAMRAVSVGDSNLCDSFIYFYLNLTNVASSMDRVVIVNSFSKSIGNVTESDQAFLDVLENVSGRVDTKMETAKGKEIAKIIQRRLFERPNSSQQKSIEKVAEKWSNWAIEQNDKMTIDRKLGELRESFEASYPFHPRVLDVFEKKWQGLGSSFQRTRGVLRMLSIWLRNEFTQSFKKNRKFELIMLGNAPLDDTEFANTVYGQMGNNEYSIPINSDVAGENSHARGLDETSAVSIKKISLHKMVATSVFFESIGGQKMSGAHTGEVKWGVCGPNFGEIADVDTCLSNLEQKGHYFRTKNNMHSIGIKTNLNRLILDEKSTIADESVRDLVYNISKHEMGNSNLATVRCNVIYPEDVPDSAAFQICMLPFDVSNANEITKAVEIAQRIVKGNNRMYKRHLAFIWPENISKLKSLARSHLTYRSIKDKSSNYQLEKSDKMELPGKISKSLTDLKDEVWNAYRKFYVGESDGSISDRSDLVGSIHSSMNSNGIADVLCNSLNLIDEINSTISHRVLEKWPSIFVTDGKKTPWLLDNLRDNVFQNREICRTRIVSLDGLKLSVSNWIKSGKAALVAVSSDGSFSHVLSDSNATEIELSMLIKFDENTGLMIPSDIPSENTTLEFEQSDLESPKDDEPAAEQNSESESVTTFTENPVEDVSINFSISAKKLNSIGMILSMNFDETDLKIEFKGRPRKGTGSNPISVLKDAINSAGGEIED